MIRLGAPSSPPRVPFAGSQLRFPVASSRLRALAVVLVMVSTVVACGLRTPVRPPERTAPIIPGNVSATRDGSVTVVHWKRAEHSADGQDLHDLTAFVVERTRDGGQTWERVATIDVVDQERIRRRRDFSWRDADAGTAGASYRVFAVCADGQEGPPTEPAVVTDKPAPVATDPAAAVDAPN
jgi:hypothetical protein